MQIQAIAGPIGQLLVDLPKKCFYWGSKQDHELMVISPG
jgi:hypothetical protein